MNRGQDPAAVADFKKIAERATRLAEGRPFELWAQDEARLGLKVLPVRKLWARGSPCMARVQHHFLNAWLHGAVELLGGGGSLFCWAESCCTEGFAEFLRRLSLRNTQTLKLVMVDNAGWHLSKRLAVPPNVRLLLQPACAPEVNPVERVWQEAKRPQVNRCFDSVQELVLAADRSLERIIGRGSSRPSSGSLTSARRSHRFYYPKSLLQNPYDTLSNPRFRF